MTVYQTNAGLGHRQLAFLLRLEKTKNGYNYLCIDTQFVDKDDTMYKVGEIVHDLEDFYVEPSSHKISETPLYGTYLLDYFLNDYSNQK